MTRFKKIKKTSDDKVHIEYEKKNKLSKWDEFSMKSAGQPAPSFERALDNLVPHVEDMCELPDKDHQVHPYTVRGVSFSYSGDFSTMGATITATRTLEDSNSPLILNSPHKIEAPYADGADDTQVMSHDCIIDLQTLMREAEAYLDGKRAQMDMFSESPDEEAVEA